MKKIIKRAAALAIAAALTTGGSAAPVRRRVPAKACKCVCVGRIYI